MSIQNILIRYSKHEKWNINFPCNQPQQKSSQVDLSSGSVLFLSLGCVYFVGVSPKSQSIFIVFALGVWI
jgi:hypothetical protein